jgi:hypothetical protein
VTGGIAHAWVQLPPGDPIYAKIGLAAARWSYMEHLFDQLIWNLAEVTPILGASITAQIMGLNPRLDTLKALLTAKKMHHKLISKVETFKQRSADAQERRNRIIHDPWLQEVASKEIGQFKTMPRKDLRYGIQPVTEAYVDETLAKIQERREDATNLTGLIWHAMKALPKTPA